MKQNRAGVAWAASASSSASHARSSRTASERTSRCSNGFRRGKLGTPKAPYAAHASSLIRAHDLNCLVERQSCLQKRAGGPALFLDEITDEQPVARIAAVTHPHRHIDGAVA